MGVTRERGRPLSPVSTGRGGHTLRRSLLLHGGQDDVGAVDLVHVPAGLGLVEPLPGQVLPLDVRLCARVEYILHFAVGGRVVKGGRGGAQVQSLSFTFVGFIPFLSLQLSFLDAALN